jgi:hypothetical protein
MLGAFMSGLASGAETMLKLRQNADELRMQLDSNEALREAAKTRKGIETKGPDYGGGGEGPSSSPDFPIPDTTATTGSGAGGGERGTSGSSGALGWGEHAKTAIDTLKSLGWKDGAIQGVLANGLAEGGFKDPWVKAGGGENSRGHWQFYERGEMPGYLKWAANNGVTDPHSTVPQVQYLAKRMEEVHPGFGQIDNPYDATDIVGTRFERYKGAAPGQRYGHLATVQKYYNQPNYGLGAPPDDQTQVAQDPYGGRDRRDPNPLTGPVASALPPVPAPVPGASAPALASSGATPGAAPGSWLAVGDSLGTGFSRFANMPGKWALDRNDPNWTGADAAAGRTPQEVMGFINDAQKYDPDYFRGKNVMLSSGVSNDPSQIDVVPQQIKALRDAGANVQLVGVGNRAGTEAGKSFDLRAHNPVLQRYATEGGAAWGGPVPAVVHPQKGYYRTPKKAIS